MRNTLGTTLHSVAPGHLKAVGGFLLRDSLPHPIGKSGQEIHNFMPVPLPHLGQRVTRAASATSLSNEDAPFDEIGHIAQCRIRR